MKRNVVLAMAVALGIGVQASALAANPFSDVPAGHWAYGAVAKLAAEGVVDGYPDGTFKGNQTMTRYEMAQIVAKALAKGAIGTDDKLVGEFADELDHLGVRIAKLEKNADNVKITGNNRISYRIASGDKLDGAKDKTQSRLRSRIWMTGEVNDNWKYVSMLENNQYFQGENESGEGETQFQRAYLEGTIGQVKVAAGRQSRTFSEGYTYAHRYDGVQAEVPVGKNVYVKGIYGKLANAYTYDGPINSKKSLGDTFWLAEVNGKWGKWDLDATYLDVNHALTADGMGKTAITGLEGDDSILTLAAHYNLGKMRLGGMYLKGDKDALSAAAKAKYPGASDDGYAFDIVYGKLSSKKPGSWHVYANYANQGGPTHIYNNVFNGYSQAYGAQGFKGYKFGARYTLAKNIVANIEYDDIKGKEDDKRTKWMWYEMVFLY